MIEFQILKTAWLCSTSKSLSLSFFLNLYLSLTCFLRCPCPVLSCEASFSISQVSSYLPIKTTNVSQSENDANYYHDTNKQARSVHRQNHRNCNNITAPVYTVFLALSVHSTVLSQKLSNKIIILDVAGIELRTLLFTEKQALYSTILM